MNEDGDDLVLTGELPSSVWLKSSDLSRKLKSEKRKCEKKKSLIKATELTL